LKVGHRVAPIPTSTKSTSLGTANPVDDIADRAGTHERQGEQPEPVAARDLALFGCDSMVISARPGDRFRLLALALVCAGAVAMSSTGFAVPKASWTS